MLRKTHYGIDLTGKSSRVFTIVKLTDISHQFRRQSEPLELDKVKTYPLASRKSKVNLEDFAKPISEMLAEDFCESAECAGRAVFARAGGAMRRARELKKPIIWGIGGHVIKTGLAPVIIDLMKRGFVTGIAANGSVLVHDSRNRDGWFNF